EATVTEAASWDSAVELTELLGRLDGQSGPGGRAPARPARPAPAKGAPAEGASGASPAAGTGHQAGERRPAAEKGRGGSAYIDHDAVSVSGAAIPVDGAAANGGARSPSDRVEHDDPALERLGGRQQWERFLAQVRETKLTLGIWLMSASVSGVDGDKLMLSFSAHNRFACEMIREEKNKRYIESQLERFYGRKFIVHAGDPANIGPSAEAAGAGESVSTPVEDGNKDDEIDKLVKDAPMVKRLMEEFDGELFRERQED
ncbi:MAG TPA: hypothetical protein VLA34_14160, partial [Candidatus Krumholzibacterium sp.]|nr:hypothetical protein [Candidatus Krumholzibacterium sp.]